MLASLIDRYKKHDRQALSRLISLAAQGEHLEEILTLLGPNSRPARVVAITGSGGVGKSTLVGKLVETLREAGQSVAVLACDPQSPLSGGALLGDRFRMASFPEDDDVFIRSLAAAGGQGALANHLDALIRILESFGFDVILIETVGAGQGDTAVHALADQLVLLLQPETGDDLQWEKAGLLEVADIVVIHKADLPGAERVEAQVKSAQMLSMAPAAPVSRVSSRTKAGLAELWQALQKCPSRRLGRKASYDLLREAQQLLARRFARDETTTPLQLLVSRWQKGEMTGDEAASQLITQLAAHG